MDMIEGSTHQRHRGDDLTRFCVEDQAPRPKSLKCPCQSDALIGGISHLADATS